jgi:diguanylate cyclase (GGDEF)-like protein
LKKLHKNSMPTVTQEERLRTRIMIVGVVTAILSMMDTLFLHYAIGVLSPLSIFGKVLVTLICLNAAHCAWRRQSMLSATRIALYGSAVIIGIFVIDQGGLQSYSLPLLAIIPVACALLFGPKETVSLTLAAIAFVIGLYVFDGSFANTEMTYEQYLRATGATMFTLLSVLVSIVVLLSRDYEEMESRLQSSLEDQSYAAMHDNLTGLANRASVKEYLHEMEASHRSTDAFLIDLDHFKIINDAEGHEAGDEVLEKVAEVLNEACEGADLVARLGGDEFVVFCEEASPHDFTRRLKSFGFGDRLTKALELEFNFSGTTYKVSASIGTARYPRDASDGSELLAKADAAMYQAKDNGRSAFVRYGSLANKDTATAEAAAG